MTNPMTKEMESEDPKLIDQLASTNTPMDEGWTPHTT
jgi:hypothetical protein